MKAAELREFTNDELVKKIEDYKEELFNLRFQKAKNKLENPYRIREIKRDVARINTLITERSRAQR